MAAPKRLESYQAIADAVRGADLTQFAAWSDLSGLSSQTRVDAVEVDPAGITVSGQKFSGVANIYVVLEYDAVDGQDPFVATDAFLGRFNGHLVGGHAVVEDFTVDVSPFFAGEELAK